jgi:hypothetical protein
MAFESGRLTGIPRLSSKWNRVGILGGLFYFVLVARDRESGGRMWFIEIWLKQLEIPAMKRLEWVGVALSIIFYI